MYMSPKASRRSNLYFTQLSNPLYLFQHGNNMPLERINVARESFDMNYECNVQAIKPHKLNSYSPPSMFMLMDSILFSYPTTHHMLMLSWQYLDD